MRWEKSRANQSRSEDASDKAERAPSDAGKNAIVLWPSIAMLALCFGLWAFLCNDGIDFVLMLACIFFSVACFAHSFALATLNRTKRSLSFLFSVLLYVATGFAPPVFEIMRTTEPIAEKRTFLPDQWTTWISMRVRRRNTPPQTCLHPASPCAK
jgi:hypothetical protein